MSVSAPSRTSQRRGQITLVWLSGEGWERVSHRLMELLKSHPNLNLESLTELQLYLDLLLHHLQDMQRSLDLFAPWLSCLDSRRTFMQTPAWQEFRDSLPAELPTLGEAAAVYDRIQIALNHFKDDMMVSSSRMKQRMNGVKNWMTDLSSAHMTVTPLLIGFRDLAEQANAAVTGMDFRFLFDRTPTGIPHWLQRQHRTT